MMATLRLYFVFIAVFCLIGLKLRECFASQMKTKSGKFIKLTIPMIFKAFLLIVVFSNLGQLLFKQSKGQLNSE